MALLNTIAAVPEAHRCAFRRDSRHEIVASRIGRLSSFGIGGWTDPLGLLLNEAMLEGAVIDHQFGTTDVFIIVPVEAIKSRYFAHFGAPDEFASPVAAEFAALN